MFSGSHWWYASVEFKHFDNLYREQQNCPEMVNGTANEESLRRVGRFFI